MRRTGVFQASAVVMALLAATAGPATAGEPLRVAQAISDPLILQAVRDIERYEGLADQMTPGDRNAGRQYLEALTAIGRRLNGVVNKNQPGWRETAERFNALQKRVADLANQAPAPGAQPPATAAAPPSTAAPPRLISSDQARLNRVASAIQSLGRQVEAAQFQAFLDVRELGNFRTAAANRRTELQGLPIEVPEVAAAHAALADVEKQIDARVADAQGRAAAVGDIEAQLAAIDRRVQTTSMPQARPDANTPEVAAYVKALIDLRAQAAADAATIEKIAGAGFRDQRIDRLRNWVGVQLPRQIDDGLANVAQMVNGRVERGLQMVAFHAATDPTNTDHVANRLLGAGRREAVLAEFDAGLVAVDAAKSVDAALARRDAPDRSAQAKAFADARALYEGRFATALAASRMPPVGITDPRYAEVAREVLGDPTYGVPTPRRIVVNSKSAERKTKREGEIRPGVVTTTVTIYDWEWDEFQVATAEPVGGEFYIFYNTLRFYHRGAPTTPTGRWILGDRFQSVRISEENVGR